MKQGNKKEGEIRTVQDTNIRERGKRKLGRKLVLTNKTVNYSERNPSRMFIATASEEE